jgi:hypothetical protein
MQKYALFWLTKSIENTFGIYLDAGQVNSPLFSAGKRLLLP